MILRVLTYAIRNSSRDNLTNELCLVHLEIISTVHFHIFDSHHKHLREHIVFSSSENEISKYSRLSVPNCKLV